MFLELPLEITLNICGHLEFKDKLALKTTCIRLNDLITKTVLYEELNLIHSTYGVKGYKDRDKGNDNIIQKLVNDQFDGSSVRILHIDIDKLSDPMISQLSNLFPNVNRIITTKWMGNYEFPRHYQDQQKFNDDTLNPLIKWRNTINKLISLYDWNQLKVDLMWSKYPRLTELDLGGLENVLNFCVRNKDVSFFSNAPLLTRLTLRDATFNLEIFEEIHAGFPLLKSLRLFHANIELKENVILPPSIAPANNLSFLGLFGVKNFYKNGVIFDYIVKKYTNLQQLVYSDNSRFGYSIKTRDDFQGGYWTFLKKSNSDEFEKRVSDEIASSKATFSIYRATESRFFSDLPKSIKHLTLDLDNVDGAIAALAESNMKIIMLDLRKTSHNHGSIYKREDRGPNMLDHFQRLTSLKTLKIVLNSYILKSTPECISLTITKLFIDIRIIGGPFYINWVLSMFPSLEDLTLNIIEYKASDVLQCIIRGQHEDSIYDINAKTTGPEKEYPQLRVLTIRKCPMHPGLFDFIKTSVPNLEKLNVKLKRDLRVPLYPNIVTEKIDISNWHLNKCDLSFHWDYSILAVCYIITIQNRSKHFIIDLSNNSLITDENTSKIDHLSPRTIWIEVTVDHIQHLNISGYHITNIGDIISINT